MVMNKNLQVILSILVAIALGVVIFYSFLGFKSSSTLTEEERIQALIDSTTAPSNSNPYSEEEMKKIIDSTTAPSKATAPNDKELKKLLDSTTAPEN
ncbi:hypothetical protein A2641_00400 [Candidatus Nomurabacteria bacterium RIFCSPHIGHO2_01_FULL_37_25]|uniref:Uncharacterized protein n=1 Tax=Candidatus Nomurabacteria bacterium RIFCSPLOWO2_01_FULL_36_16 TaxID=1801767 RepID=A0A1F6WZC4_9BACT|nr:MAG: hypothetical protein A2641_00400 [Candidatus Nomurabacteria bacterium RIFCSPHIGHO2_01_FULL_37_25]OGI75869.1 MAG: hypothetical protein A3D36_01185 [Candidatus Nomurabacteria bacterium RIFCSPHIGHO2_02_FULL_36_29]OGI87228.1 MAG: hypothetical protein A3A91_03800 [Candidatus Nomurabacteria bacterium RIFCSPLOWO2_01_FULL_36_16]